ncbi:MAG: transcription-repair coupling factor [Acidobacteriia bacterium]|nr:transcription-repair coupling factor [Terriglobia bacterium]
MTRFEELFGAIEAEPEFQSLLDRLKAVEVCSCALEGLTEGAKAPVLALLGSRLHRPLLIITARTQPLEEFSAALNFYYREISGHKAPHGAALPAYDCRPYDRLSPHAAIAEQRALALALLRSDQAKFVVCAPPVALSRWPEPEFFDHLSLSIYKDQPLNPDTLKSWLASSGYYSSEPVSSIGEFSMRGGILDVFSPSESEPLRIEFLGDNIESIRRFNVENQRSLRAIDAATLVAVRDIPASPQSLQRWAAAAERHLSPEFRAAWADQIEAAAAGESFAGFEFALPLDRPFTRSLPDLLKNPLVVFEEEEAIREAWRQEREKLEQEFTAKQESLEAIVPPDALYFSAEEIQSIFRGCTQLRLNTLEMGDAVKAVHSFSLPTQPVRRFRNRFAQFVAEEASLEASGFRSVAIVRSNSKADILKDVFQEYAHEGRTKAGWSLKEDREGIVPPNRPQLKAPIPVQIGEVDTGFLLPRQRFAVFGDLDLFEEVEYRSSRSARPKRSPFISDFSDLKIGDLMVHVDHGIGKFMGIKSLQLQEAAQEFMELHYQEDAKLYIPLERLDWVQKYSGAGGHRPPLDKLGGVTWERTKSRAQKRIRILAEDLLKLYAQRKVHPGFAFSPDSEWMREFEAAFEFTETPDQALSIDDVKRDMQSTSPMDRLVCGDVGYGKTEVAMRAALKAVVDHKQVGVLTPTTVLAYQHYVTFKRRFDPFPVNIEMLSRFRDKKQQKTIVENLAAGKIDIVIGTHRLLSKDVQFLDLGLLIVDEEQRFGVGHKEKLKQLTQSVDCLTLTATPIPRTLQMSLMGVRDMSLIETPPKDRLAIQTVVTKFDVALIQTSIEHELDRGGQVYLVHNRVESIYSIAALVARQVPRARIAVAHGQMSEHELEQVMLKFMRHEFDVLVATTLIENGLDIPLVNTLIVNRADKFGLAQLYQLRGRVGRSNRRAYAYLLVPPDQGLTPIARRRLNALKEFTDLGSGFRVAALDLELRGAGTLLGAQQHGFLNSVGFDTYCQLLERTIQELKGEELPPETRCSINLRVDIKIPGSFITDENLRLVTYKRISNIRSDGDALRLREELRDRFGELPEGVQNLLAYAQLKFLAESLQVKIIERDKSVVYIQFHPQTQTAPESLVRLVEHDPEVSFTPAGWLKIQLQQTVPSYILARTRQVLEELHAPAPIA